MEGDAIAVAGELPHVDVSIIGLILRADIIVKLVMLILLFASVIGWAIIVDRLSVLSKIKQKFKVFESAFWSGQPLDELFRRVENHADHPAARVFIAAVREWRRCHQDGFTPKFIRDRVDSVVGIVLNRELEGLEGRLGFLATVGSAAPFIGLFGTVWGIMNSFTAIANSNNTSLTVVAPGIAEALFATALGLVAAIPAVIAYNKISGELNRYASRLENFSEELTGVLAKQTEDKVR